MNLRSLVVVVLRLMALDFLLRAAVQLTPQLLRFTEMFSEMKHLAPDTSGSLAFFPWLLIFGMVVCAALIWIFALPIARLVTRGVQHDLSFGSLSLVDCYSIAFVGVGLVYITSHLPQVLNWTHYLFKAAATHPGDTWKEGVQWYQVSNAFIPFIVGVILFVKGRAWAEVLAHRQKMADPPNERLERPGAPPCGSGPE